MGEAIALRRADVDLDRRTVTRPAPVTVSRQYIELADQLVLGPPKSRAEAPDGCDPALCRVRAARPPGRLRRPEDTDLTGSLGGILRRGNFRRDSGWAAAVSKLGVTCLHLHDLRHTGNMLAAPGASLADLKARMGHDSARAAMIYQHAMAVADAAIADALDRLITAASKASPTDPDSS